MNLARIARNVAASLVAISAVSHPGIAQAVVTYNDNVTPAAIFGSGNANGSFTVDRQNGVELGLRGKIRYPVPSNTFNSNGDGTYTFRAGVFNGANNPQWHFEWSVNSDYTGMTGNKLDDFTYLLEMDFDPGPGTNFLAWDHISYPTSPIPFGTPANPGFYDHSIGTNATASGAGVEAANAGTYSTLLPANNVAQNSWRYPFYSAAPFLFDANATGTYEIRLTAFQGVNVMAQVSIRVQVEGYVTPDIILGSGNSNGHFTLDRANGVELGLRGKIRFPTPQNVYNDNYDGTYTFLAGVFNGVENPQWNFEWSINTDYTGLTGNKLDDFTYLLEMDFDPGAGTDFLAWDHVSFPTSAIPYDTPVTPPYYDHSIGTNATPNGGGVEATSAGTYAPLLPANNVAQNSWRYTFYDGAPFFFNAASVGRYDIRLTAFDGVNVAAQVTAQIKTVLAGTCFVDAVCDDGNACNGVETCNLTTNECEFGTEVDCSGLDDQCNVGVCVDPAGTCVASPVTDGTTCDEGDTCSIADTCQTGVCTAGGGGDTDSDGTCDNDDLCPSDPAKLAPGTCGCGVADTNTDGDGQLDCNETCDSDPLKLAPGQCGCGNPDTDGDGDLVADCVDACPVDPLNDVDGDTVCGDVDNCPNDANTDQADTDNDDVGNVCDSVDADGSLVLSQVLVRAANPDGGTGRVRLGAVLIDGIAGDRLGTDLALGNVVVDIAAGAFATSAPVGTCVAGANRVKCRNDAAGVKATFTRLVQGDNNVPDIWKMRLSQRQVTATGTPTSPATVSVVQPTPSITRTDETSVCTVKPGRLSCRED